MNIFNRRELTATFDAKRQAELRELLSSNGIDYSIKTVNRRSPSPLSAGSRPMTGSAGEKAELAYEYVFFVSKSDFETASRLLRR